MHLNKSIRTHLISCKQFFNFFFVHSRFLRGRLQNLFVKHLLNVRVSPSALISRKCSNDTVRPRSKHVAVFIDGDAPNGSWQLNVLRALILQPKLKSFVLSSRDVETQSERLHCEDESSVSKQSLNWLQVGTPNLHHLIVGARNDQSRAFDVGYFSNDVSVGVLSPLYLHASVPVPQVERLVLRTADNVIIGSIVINAHCMLMLLELAYLFLLTQRPNDCFSIPRATNNMIRVNKI